MLLNLSRRLALAAALSVAGTLAHAAQCGNDAGGFEAWKAAFAREAAAQGVGQRGLNALAQTRYATDTIRNDRNQKSFRYSLDKFMDVRGAGYIVQKGRQRKAQNPGLYQALESRYGVPAGVLIAIHGMETGFGSGFGKSNIVSAITTVAYDCRRSAFFTPHALGALILIDRGALAPNAVGAYHGEIGHTQFLPGNALRYGVDGDGNGRVDLFNIVDSLATTANFLRQKGWRPGQGYQEGQANFAAIREWNAAGVYQKAIAIMAARIDG